jgi:pyruvate/2-oxoacid:ferredoxin oxidoreductase alpha subunit
VWYVVAAVAPAGTGASPSNEVIISIVGLLVAIVTVLGGVAVALINTRKVRPVDTDEIGVLRERVAVVEQQTEDSEARDEIQDRRLDRIERHLDFENPRRWRRE